MDDNKLRFGVGVLVIAAIGVGIILTFLFGAFPTVFSREYKLLVEFPSAAGVSTNTPVLRDGVKIGRVTDIQLLEHEGVLLELAMDDRHKISHEYIPQIGIGSVITGDSTLEFVRGTPQQLQRHFPTPDDQQLLSQPYGDADYIRYGMNAKDPFNVLFNMEEEVRQTMQSIRNAGNSIDTAGQNVNQLVSEVRQVVGGTDDKMDGVADEAKAALEQFQGAIRDVRRILNNPKLEESLEDALATLPDVLGEARTTLQATQKTFGRFEKVGERFEKVGERFEKVGERFESVGEFAEGAVKDVGEEAGEVVRNVNKTVDTVRSTVQGAGRTLKTIEGTFQSAERTIENVEKFSQPLAASSDEIVQRVVQNLKRLEQTLAQAEAFGESLNNGDGTIKRLLEDDQIYWQVRRTIENIEQASARIKPIMDDVRIFSDKIARDPRQLGIRGAVTRRPNGMGLK